ncbi:DUF6894 family protein [Sphingomonas sp. Root241]|uniref:DUF6894 family protein n=1 Tax=Sphingomonas sp. Root241 TaxID=1736501 RepID=UPI0006F8B9AC|nr:hypothetical protein [Sphingomonas sp. Root241]KRC79122.1 hypothetical protein ASE13_17035 [Sphingomonas sp. Root241]
MPLYYFHLRDGIDVLLDPEGRELDSHEAIVTATLVEARGLLGAEVRTGQLDLDQMIDVEDEAGAVVHRLRFADALTIVWPTPQPG